MSNWKLTRVEKTNFTSRTPHTNNVTLLPSILMFMHESLSRLFNIYFLFTYQIIWGKKLLIFEKYFLEKKRELFLRDKKQPPLFEIDDDEKLFKFYIQTKEIWIILNSSLIIWVIEFKIWCLYILNKRKYDDFIKFELNYWIWSNS